MDKQFSSVWTRQETRPPKASGLGRDRIVAAAMEILDGEGLAALSMRRLGAKLGAGATSLYWYVATKDDLLELVLDEFWGTVEVADPERASWREVVTSFAYGMRQAMLAHPWSASLVGQMPSMGPNSLRLSDRLRRTFVQAGFTGTDVYLASGTVMCFVLGQVIPDIAWRVPHGDEDSVRAAVIEQTLGLADQYPEMVAEYLAAPRLSSAAASELAFDFALVCALDGLAARLRQPGAVPSEAVPRET